ncbi:Acetyl esterase/lipase [Pseudomonas cuatrocienegasensis]|uniref:Acetyl esterase/lipase n=1 Tax=Pseudomonas cuatrocienegasensis TaxID=543360 RepID=A0ABY1B1B9_9PSED|nr:MULTISPECIES: alpha/beta hydrolase [Pseudomonas]OEC36529.1 alpha/beta hydrolase [Pseudomonas sp. 21C1]SEP68438.1 Acetyl esterase/lipase [Pseudomonas cuatrocienegasensis]
MTASADFIAPPADQPLLRSVLRGALRVLFRGLVRPPLPVPFQRAVIRALTAATLPVAGVSREAGHLGGRPCEWHRPSQPSGSVLLYLHGGAYVAGSPATHRAICAHLAARTQASVCALDYRLSPESRYPAAREDAIAAYQALLAAGYPAQRIAFVGDSAGGNLSLITSLRLRHLGLPQPGALVCFSPVTDFTGSQLHSPAGGDPLIHPNWVTQAIGLYCPADVARDDPGLSPQFDDLTGLAPLLLQVGEDEILLNDSLRFAAAAQAAGVEVQLERYPGLWHVFQAHAGLLHVADFALARVALFLKARGF